MDLATLGSTLDVEGAGALFTENAHNRVNERKNNWISGCLSKGEMKIQVSFNEGRAILERTIHHFDRFFHRRDIGFLGALRSELCNPRFQNFANLRQVEHALGMADSSHKVE